MRQNDTPLAPPMRNAAHYRWLAFFALLLLCGFVRLASNLCHIQVARHEELAAKAERSRLLARPIEPIRGEIRDSEGRILAVDEPVKSVFVNPCQVGAHAVELAHALGYWLQTDPKKVLSKLKRRLIGRDTFGMPVFETRVRIKSRVSWEEWQRLRHILDGCSFGIGTGELSRRQKKELYRLRNLAVVAEDDHARRYPFGATAGNVVGFLSADGKSGHLAGRDGIEASMNAFLEGEHGFLEGERDILGTEVTSRRKEYRAPLEGFNVVLTIDLDIQRVLESELEAALLARQAAGAMGVVVQPRTGRILALATLPAFNPQDPASTPPSGWQNRVLVHVYEPGSTFKIVVYSALLNERLGGMDSLVDCGNGRFVYQGAVLSERLLTGLVSLERAIAQSSSVAAAQLGLVVGKERLEGYARAFGFGQPTGIPLPYERSGTVHPLKNWTPISPTRVAIGYEVAITPIQMVMAMSAIANDGRRMRPMLVDRIEDNRGRVVIQARPQAVRDVITPAAASQLIRGLRGVTSHIGTGRLAAIEGHSVAGKTGTSYKAGPQGYQRDKYTASFCGFFPADAPELCILVVLDEPQGEHLGGRTAGPAFRNIGARVAQHLRIPPDEVRLASSIRNQSN